MIEPQFNFGKYHNKKPQAAYTEQWKCQGYGFSTDSLQSKWI